MKRQQERQATANGTTTSRAQHFVCWESIPRSTSCLKHFISYLFRVSPSVGTAHLCRERTKSAEDSTATRTRKHAAQTTRTPLMRHRIFSRCRRSRGSHLCCAHTTNHRFDYFLIFRLHPSSSPQKMGRRSVGYICDICGKNQRME